LTFLILPFVLFVPIRAVALFKAVGALAGKLNGKEEIMRNVQ
jgi:hypothetical protein